MSCLFNSLASARPTTRSLVGNAPRLSAAMRGSFQRRIWPVKICAKEASRKLEVENSLARLLIAQVVDEPKR